MKKKLEFAVEIRSPRPKVWETMLGQETYKDWTSAFCDGSYFSGSWAKGEKMKFLAPSGDGMTSVIAENKHHEYISIRHLGEIAGGVEDTTSEKVRSWAPAYENYTFSEVAGGTKVRVDVDVLPEYETYMKETFPKSLDRLRVLCEGNA